MKLQLPSLSNRKTRDTIGHMVITLNSKFPIKGGELSGTIIAKRVPRKRTIQIENSDGSVHEVNPAMFSKILKFGTAMSMGTSGKLNQSKKLSSAMETYLWSYAKPNPKITLKSILANTVVQAEFRRADIADYDIGEFDYIQFLPDLDRYLTFMSVYTSDEEFRQTGTYFVVYSDQPVGDPSKPLKVYGAILGPKYHLLEDISFLKSFMPNEEFKVINPTLSAAYKKSLVDKGWRREDVELEGILADLQGKFPVGRLDLSKPMARKRFDSFKHYLASKDIEIGNVRLESGASFYLGYNISKDKTTLLVRYGREMQFISYDIDNDTLYKIVGASSGMAKNLDGTPIIDLEEAMGQFDEPDHINTQYNDPDQFIKSITDPDTLDEFDDHFRGIFHTVLGLEYGDWVETGWRRDSKAWTIELDDCEPACRMPSKSDIDIGFKLSGYDALPAFGGKQHFVHKLYPANDYWVDRDMEKNEVVIYTKNSPEINRGK